MIRKMKSTEYGLNSINNLSTGLQKIIRMYEQLFVEMTEGKFLVILCSL